MLFKPRAHCNNPWSNVIPAWVLMCLVAVFGCKEPVSEVRGIPAQNSVGNAETGEVGQNQNAVVSIGTVHLLQSQILDEARTLNVYIPPHASERPDMRFPVIYLLDGAEHEDYLHITGLVQFLTLYELMPPSIVVGIANVDRYRDFTYPSSNPEDLKSLPTSGGSEKFRAFLAEELKPFVDQNFPSSGNATLIGQSLGGLLATEVFLKTPQLFQQYLIVSPSLWWDGGQLQSQLADGVKNYGEGTGTVFLALGEEGPEMQAGVDAFVAALKAHAPKGLTWFSEAFPEETHATVLHRAVYKGFERLYEKSHPGM